MIHHAAWLRRLSKDDGWAQSVAREWRTAQLAPGDRALADYAAKLSTQPPSTTEADVQALRDAGFDDRAIHDACAVAAYFAFVNRIIAGLGVQPETDGRSER
ncbi:MAG: peroxidase-related enzyme [Planctomycetota bacterium]